MSRRLWAGILSLAMLALAGCVAPPSSGPVVAGASGPVSGQPDPLVRPIANPPRAGMTPTEVVAGFLNATAVVGEDYQVARQYLTAQGAAQWNPGAGVTVMATGPVGLSSSEDSQVVASFVATASVTASGVYDNIAPNAQTVAFPMTQVDDQWRIDEAPPGLLMSKAELDRTFQTMDAFFVDPGGSIAVPDVRVVPRTGAQALATALVTALLAGPSDWLAPAVRSEIPLGTQLSLGAVPVTDAVARVELSGPTITLDDAASQRFGAQFGWTLRQVPQVQAVEVVLNGQPLVVGARRGPVELSAFDSFNPDVVELAAPLYGVTDDGAPAVVNGDQVTRLGPPSAGLPAVSAVAVSPRRDAYAAASADGESVLVGSLRTPDQPPQVIGQPIAGAPRLDAAARLWWTDPKGVAHAAQQDDAGSYRELTVQWQGTPGPVRALRPSRDGTRIAVLVGGGDVPIMVGAVVGDVAGQVSIVGLRQLGERLQATDAAWHDARQLTSLDPAGGVIRRTDLMGGTVAVLSAPANAVTVTDAPGVNVVLGLGDSSAGPLTGNGVRTLTGLHAPAYPG